MPRMNSIIIVLLTFLEIFLPKISPLATNQQITTSLSSSITLALNSIESSLEVTPTHLSPIVVGPSIIDQQQQANAQPESVKQIAERMVEQTFGPNSFNAFDKVITVESEWDPNAVNPETGACGIGQALPCKKMPDHSITGQLSWVITYIANRYGSPQAAWHHELAYNWY